MKIVIKGNDFQKIRDHIKKNKNKKIIFSGNNDEINRKVLEKEKIDILLINQKERKDTLKQRNSGLNHILAKIAKENNVVIGINLDEILNAKSQKQKAEIIGRIMQNIKLCNKKKINMCFVSEENKKNLHCLKSLGLILGMPTWMTSSLDSEKN